MMKTRQLFTTFLLVGSALAFAPPHASLGSRHKVSIFASEEDAVDPFDSYELTDSQQLATKDVVVGTGPAVEAGNVLTVAYKGRFLGPEKVGEQFDFSEKYVFKIGEGKVLPGWEQGLLGMKVGGERTLRIPPSLAYGDKWFKGTIPPSSHLEFDCELKSIAQGQQEELMVQLDQFGVGRAIGLVVCVLFLAISPMLS